MRAAILISLLTIALAAVELGGLPPLRDPGISRGPDGTWYLVATTGPAHRNQGAQAWSSPDLKTWTDLGLIWDLHRHPDSNAHNHAGSAWQCELYPVPGLPLGERGRAMTAPRLAWDGTRWWLTFSMNGYAAGAMPSRGAKPADGFVDTRLIVEAGAEPSGRGDASLVVLDGAAHLVWGGGCVARLKDPAVLEKLSHNGVGVDGPVRYLPGLIAGFPGDDGLPEHGDPYGVSLVQAGADWHLVFTATTLRDGGIHEDAYVATGSAPTGPFAKPRLLAADAGRAMLFADAAGALQVVFADPQGRVRLTAFAPRAAAVTPTPAPPRGEIATTLPPLPTPQRPEGIKQLLPSLTPAVDRPLRDAALCRGGDGAWYLTGTEAVRAADGTCDWSRNHGVRIWRSTDQQTWTDLGLVWDLDRDAPAWAAGAHLDRTCGATPRIGRAVTAPELFWLRDTFWIVYAVNGQRIGLLKSTSGTAAGPYAPVGGLLACGRDPSLLVEGDAVHLVWGQGFVASLAPDLSTIAGPVRTLFTNVQWYPRYLRRPENLGLWGSHLIKTGDWYVWNVTTRSGRLGISAIDTVASWSKSLDGPWGEPCLMLPHGGQSTLVSDGAKGLVATVSGEDPYAACPFRAALTPVGTDGGAEIKLKAYGPKDVTAQFHALDGARHTALDLWIGVPDLIPCTIRDVCVTCEPDGTYYATGSFWGVEAYRRDTVLFRSRDLLRWEALPPVFTAAQSADVPGLDGAKIREFIAKDDGKTPKVKIQIGEQKLVRIGTDYYMAPMHFSGLGGVFLLKSTSGKPEGPYRGIRTLPTTSDFWQDEDGAILMQSSMGLTRFPDAQALETLPREQWRPLSVPLVAPDNICYSEDCEMGIMRIGGRYVNWTTDWTGCYDAVYLTSASWKGPWTGSFRILPYGGNGRFFRDPKGVWWYAYFPNINDAASRAPNACRMNMYPLRVADEGGELVIEPQAYHQARGRLERMGRLW